MRALGYDMNSIEFAIRDGVPYAIDFMNPAPDMDINSLTPALLRVGRQTHGRSRHPACPNLGHRRGSCAGTRLFGGKGHASTVGSSAAVAPSRTPVRSAP